MSPRDRIRRRIIPRTVVALSALDAPRWATLAARRLRGGSGSIRLFLAFDDPNGAVALLGLAERLRDRDVKLVVEPVVERGIPGDPAVEAKRRYAVIDSRRLGARDGLVLSRAQPISPDAAAFLARWTASIADDPTRAAFAAAAIRYLWLESTGPIEPGPYLGLWKELVGGDPPADGAAAVRRVEKRMKRRGLYDTPVAIVAGQWFFAHERLAQIESRLDALGWGRR